MTASNSSPPASNVFAKRMLTAVNFFVETNRLEPYTAVYLIAIKGWNEVHFGIVSLVTNLTMVAFQTPAGDLLDKTKKKKKLITMMSIIIAAVTTVMVVWTSNFWAILAGKTIEGISATIFLPALMALLLGICHIEEEVPSYIAITETSNKIGSCLFICASAAISYYAYPNVEAMFYLLGAGGLAAAVFTFLIPESSIDHDRARQLNTAVVVEDDTSNDDDDEDEDADDLAIAAFAKNFVKQRSLRMLQSEGDLSSKSTFFHTGSTSFVILNANLSSLKCSSGRLSTIGRSSMIAQVAEDCPNETVSTEDEKAKPSRYRDLLKRPSIIAFAIVTFFYHLTNAGITPLLAQHLAISSSARASLAWTSSLMLVAFFCQAITTYIMSYTVDKFAHKSIMMVAFLILPIRCALIAVLVSYWSNPWALAATSTLEGLGAGVYDTMLPIIVKRMTQGSGRFGFTFGFIVTCWRLGHGVSVFFGEAIVHSFGYAAVFIVLGCMGLMNLLVFTFFYSPYSTRAEKKDGKSKVEVIAEEANEET
jgi:MFS family permease